MTHFIPRRMFSYAAACVLSLTSLGASASYEKPGEGVKVRPSYPIAMEERVLGEIAIAGLKELGYDVKTPSETEIPTMLLAVSYGDADYTVNLWEKLHASFYKRAGGDDTMVRVGDMVLGLVQGYMIDKKTAEAHNIRYITDMKKPEIAKLFDTDNDGKADLTGCNPGWGCELVIEHHLNAYDLNKSITHVRGSYTALIADTIARFNEGQPVFYYAWLPQWVGGILVEGRDVVWLEVPKTDLPDGDNQADTTYQGKNLGFAKDKVEAAINKAFAEENPALVKFLSQLRVSSEDISAENFKLHDGEDKIPDIQRHAKEWIAAHRQEFDGWLENARKAATVTDR